MVQPTPKERRKQARNAMYRGLIIEAAEEVFAEAGYEAARVQDVASACGISLATLYGVFRSKEELYRAVHRLRLNELMTLIAEGMSAEEDPLSLLLSRVEVYVRFHMRHVNYLRMHLREDNAWASGSSLRSTEQSTAWETGLAWGTGAFQAAMDGGQVVQDCPEVLFRTSVAMNQVRLADWVNKGMQLGADELIPKMRATFLRAFCTPEELVRRQAEE